MNPSESSYADLPRENPFGTVLGGDKFHQLQEDWMVLVTDCQLKGVSRGGQPAEVHSVGSLRVFSAYASKI